MLGFHGRGIRLCHMVSNLILYIIVYLRRYIFEGEEES